MNILNKLKIIFFAFVLLFIYKANAQIKTDSLHYYLSKISKTTPKDSTTIYFSKAKGFATEMQLIQLARTEAKYKVIENDFEAAYTIYNKTIAKSIANEYEVMEGLLYFDLSNYFYDLNKYETSYKFVVKAKNIIENISKEALADYNRNNLKHQDYTKASLLRPILFNIGVIAHDNNDLEKAEKHYKESFQYFKNKNEIKGQYIALSNLAGIHISRKEYNKAIQSNLQILKEFDLNKEEEGMAYYNLAISFYELKEYTNATLNIDHAIALSKSINDELQLIDLRYLKAEIELERNNPLLAKELLMKSLNKAVEIDDYFIQEDLFKLLAKSEMRLANYKEADFWFDKMFVLKDFLRKNETESYYNRINLEDRLKQQDRIFVKEKESKNRLLWIIFLGVVMGVVSLFSFLLYKKNNYQKILLAEFNS